MVKLRIILHEPGHDTRRENEEHTQYEKTESDQVVFQWFFL
jgi:hypothetical protein